MNKNWKAYVTYCNDNQKNEFNIKETEHIKLINIFEDLPLPNINHINHHYSQIISMYYVWKNNLYSDYVCIWDHRRFFTPINFDMDILLEYSNISKLIKFTLEKDDTISLIILDLPSPILPFKYIFINTCPLLKLR